MNTQISTKENDCISHFSQQLFKDCVYYEQTQNNVSMQNKFMKYKGYYAHVLPCEGNELVGEVIGLENLRFYAHSVSDLLIAFEENIERYLTQKTS
ncbi:MAG: hypothetical protein PHQ03_11600 [Methylococcales bacterium]|nr:hypothetical protein [Methylococcales bacterium]